MSSYFLFYDDLGPTPSLSHRRHSCPLIYCHILTHEKLLLPHFRVQEEWPFVVSFLPLDSVFGTGRLKECALLLLNKLKARRDERGEMRERELLAGDSGRPSLGCGLV